MIAEYNLPKEDRIALAKSRIATTKGGLIVLLGIILPCLAYGMLLRFSYNRQTREFGPLPANYVVSFLICVGIAIIAWGAVIAIQGMIAGSRAMKVIEDRQKAGR
jgi:hypothetical protein